MSEFYIKLTFRIIHVTAGCLIIGNALTDGIFGKRNVPRYGLFLSIAGILLFIAGVVNLILLKPSQTMGNERGPWLTAIYAKIAMWAFLLPIPEWICSLLGFEFPRTSFNVLLMIAVILVSSFAKQFRDKTVLNRLKRGD